MAAGSFNKFLSQNNLILQQDKIVNYDQMVAAFNGANGSQVRKAVYLGIDPTSSELHLGHLIQLVMLKKMEQYFKVIIVIGTSTGEIGDPSGKKSERKIISTRKIRENAKKIKVFLEKCNLFKKCLILENHEWIMGISVVDFLRNYCKHLNMTTLLNKSIVKARLKTGISASEFLYTIIQGIDFLQLFENYNCIGQIGGSDQKGNIINGIELIKAVQNRNKESKKLFGITTELLTDKNGNKIGKTVGNKIPLVESDVVSSRLFNFLYNIEDNIEQIRKHFQLFTDYSKEQINLLITESQEHGKYEKFLQIELCRVVISQLVSYDTFEHNLFFAKTIFQKHYDELSDADWLKIKKVSNLPQQIFSCSEPGIKIVVISEEDFYELRLILLLVQYKICLSQKKAKILLKSSAISINNVLIKLAFVNNTVATILIKQGSQIKNKIFIMKIGKRRQFIVRLKGSN